MHIRKAILEDIDSIFSLYNEQFEVMADLMPYFFKTGEHNKEFIKSMIESEEADIILCTENEKAMGFVLLQTKEKPDFHFFVKHKYAYLMDIVITKEMRGKGYGNALMDEAKRWAINRQLDHIELDVLSNNDSAIGFYENHNFKEKVRSMYCEL